MSCVYVTVLCDSHRYVCTFSLSYLRRAVGGGGGGLVQVLSWLTQRLFFFLPSLSRAFFLLLFFLDTLLNEGHFGWLAFFFNCWGWWVGNCFWVLRKDCFDGGFVCPICLLFFFFNFFFSTRVLFAFHRSSRVCL